MAVSRFHIISRILKLSFQRPVIMTLSVLLATVSSLAYFIPYLAIYRLLAALIENSAPAGSLLLRYGVIAFVGAAINVMAYFGSLILSHIAAFRTSYDLKLLLAEKFSRIPLGFHISAGTGKQFHLIGSSVDRIQSFIAHKLPDIIASIVYPVTLIVLILRVDWRYGLAMAIAIALAYVFHYLSMGRGGAKRMMELYYTYLDDMENSAVECVRGVSVLKNFGHAVGPYQKLKTAIGNYTSMVIPYTRNWEKHMCWFVMIISNIYLFLIPVALYDLSKSPEYSVFATRFIFYLIIAPSIVSVIPKIGRIMEEFMRVYTDVEHVSEALETSELPQGSKTFQDTAESQASSRELCFNDVSFSYSDDQEILALSNVSFKAVSGKVTAIVGPSGSGKSTISSLIARFWDVSSGSITLGGTDIRDVPLEELMQQVAFVLQNDRLFSQSIMENIRIARKGASDKEVLSAAKAANCHSFISGLPEGYDTPVGAGGVQLSAGQRQRLTLARAILKDAPIIVLDEATASLDAENEALVQDAISRLIANKTVIMVAHRLGTIKNADEILVMERGRIVERGTHDALIDANGLYSTLWNSYCNTQDWKVS